MDQNQANIFLMEIYEKAEESAFRELEEEFQEQKDFIKLQELQEIRQLNSKPIQAV